jgi:hypothetical protein
VGLWDNAENAAKLLKLMDFPAQRHPQPLAPPNRPEPIFWGRQGGFACRVKAFEGKYSPSVLPASAARVTARVGESTV